MTDKAIITPTIGRVVWYHPDNVNCHAALITHVWRNNLVNLVIFDSKGLPYNGTSVLLVQDGGPVPSSNYAEWMPYQKGQAAKYDKLKEELVAAEKIAKVAHEINAAYCRATGDDSQPPWEDAPDWQKESAINGVKFHIETPGASPEDSHDSWLEEKRNDGWQYGPEKDPEAKRHPCMMPYSELPIDVQVKDHLFIAVVNSLKE